METPSFLKYNENHDGVQQTLFCLSTDDRRISFLFYYFMFVPRLIIGKNFDGFFINFSSMSDAEDLCSLLDVKVKHL